ncbi:peptidase C1 [Mesorhizobium sp. CN2-181]|uniref:peptidase C1 n=1 Tax=Mesorhizobium yinganensis TaxID=3157707 RepID=UPI0032B81248
MARSADNRVFDALPDTVDFRDQMYVPTLVEVAAETDVNRYRARKIPVLDQGREGACTGYGLATVVNFLLRTGRTGLSSDKVSAQMLYAMAKRYDEWPGEDYEGSSARGAMKGWHKHGVCGEKLWSRSEGRNIELDDLRAADALGRPLGAYFRVNHRDLVGMHSAITEAGILFATALVRRTVAPWAKKRVLLYAHGGLVSEDSALQFVANNRQFCLASEVYPIAFIWRSDAWTTLKNVLTEALLRRKPEGILDAAKDFMLDRLDDTIEPIARTLGGKTLWDEMKENATLAASSAKGGARMTAEHLIEAVKAGEVDELHLAGHSAGSILMAPLAKFLVESGVRITSLSLWAPACTVDLFEKSFLPLLKLDKGIDAFDLYTLDDATERNDDCANIYHKSLLYLVSGAFEAQARIPIFRPDGTPLLGLARDVENLLKPIFTGKTRRWIRSPGDLSRAVHHGDFDNDETTLRTTLERITGSRTPGIPAASLVASPAARARFRQGLDKTLRTRP